MPLEQDKHKRCFDALVGKAVAVGTPDALDQTVGFHFAQIVAELREGVGAGGKAEGSEDGLMDISRPPSIELRAAMQEHLHQPHHAGIVNLAALKKPAGSLPTDEERPFWLRRRNLANGGNAARPSGLSCEFAERYILGAILVAKSVKLHPRI